MDGNPPDVLVIAGGLNDCAAGAGSPFTPAEVQTESLAYFQALRAAAPNMMMVAVGPFTDWNNPGYGPTWIACRDAIFASASKVSGTYTIDVSDWVTPANRDTVFNGNAYGPHPVDAGHAIYGARFANAFASIVNGLP